MASTPAVPENSCHVRCTSMPTRSHPLVIAVEEDIRKLEAWKIPSSISPSPLTAEMIVNGLCGLTGVYDCIEDLLQLPLGFYRQNEKWVDDLLDGSVRLLDMCSTTRDILLQMKEHVRDLQSALRRKGGDSSTKNGVKAYISSTKKVKKDISRCISELRRMDKKCSSTPLADQDQHFSTVAGLLREMSVITTSSFQTIFLFLSASKPKPNTSKRSWGSRLVNEGQVACVGEDQKDMNEVERVEIALYALLDRTSAKDEEIETVHVAQKRLEAFEAGIEGLEAGLECMFRCLIRYRVSLLNILTW